VSRASPLVLGGENNWPEGNAYHKAEQQRLTTLLLDSKEFVKDLPKFRFFTAETVIKDSHDSLQSSLAKF